MVTVIFFLFQVFSGPAKTEPLHLGFMPLTILAVALRKILKFL